jgi:6,7-dimethyl-8-ribityllumazine synthase
MTQLQVIEGQVVVPSGARFVVVASRFNHFIVARLVDGAVDAVRRHGGQDAPLALVKVPGAWEIPHAVARLARKVPEAERGQVGIIALGAVIRGSTPHFDYVANEVTKGIATVSLETGVAVTFGILTTDSIEQAIERAGTKACNKGWEAAMSVIEMLSLHRALETSGL